MSVKYPPYYIFWALESFKRVFLHNIPRCELFLPQVNYNEGKPEKLVYVKAGRSVKVFTC